MAEQLGSLEKVLRFGEGRRVKRLAQQAAYIGTLEAEFEKLSDAELAGKTAEFKQRIENGEPVDELVFEAFAAVREAFKRSMGIGSRRRSIVIASWPSASRCWCAT